MKISNKLKLALLAVLAIIALVACSGQAEVDLNNYVAFNYEGFDGSGKADLSVDYNKLLTDHEKELGEKKAMAALRLLRNIEVTANKTEGLSNGDAITVKWGEINTEELLNEAGLKVTYSEFATTVAGLNELEKVDIFKGIEVKVNGTDTQGYGYVSTSNMSSDFWFIEYEMEKSENLSNGEKVKIIAKDYEGGDIDKKLADIGKVAASKEYIYTVTGLEELEEYDPFNGVTLTFKGINGEGTVEINKDYLVNDYVYSFDYIPDKTEGLSNGDVVVVKVENDYGDYKTVEDFAASRGLRMTVNQKEFTVEGLLEPFSDPKQIDEIDPFLFDLLRSEDVGKIKEYWAKGEERSVEVDSLLNVEYLGTIITYQKPTSWTAEHSAMYNIYRCDVKCSFDEPRWVYWYSLYDDIKKDENGKLIIPEPTCPSTKYTVSTFMISGEAFTTEDKTHFYLGYETYEKFRSNHIRNEENVIYDDVDVTEGEHFNPAFAVAHIIDKNSAEIAGNIDFSGIGSTPVYRDGQCTINMKLSDFEGAPEVIDGLTVFEIRILGETAKKADIDITNAIFTDFYVHIDGEPINVNNDNIQVEQDDSGLNFIIRLFDNDLGLTGKNAAVKSKGFSFKDNVEISFIASGIPQIKIKDIPDKVGTVNTDGNNDPGDSENVDNTENIDNTDNTDNIDNTENTDNAGNDNDDDLTEVDNTDNISENGTGEYKVILAVCGEDRTRMIKLVQDYTHMGLIPARDLVDNVANEPMVILQTDDKDYAEVVKNAFEEYGAIILIEGSGKLK